jgi:Carbohydrate-selective porin, OprB family/S-layer homology domain
MQKRFGKVLLLNTVALSCCFLGVSKAIADENSSVVSEDFSETLQQLDSVGSVESNMSPTLETDLKSELSTESFNLDSFNNTNNLGQVNSVFLLKDVSATDWAFQSLKSLVEKYSCVAGYPDGTFRGNRALSRYEFAAVLDSCLRQVETLINSDSAPSKEDLDALARLTRDFEQELAQISSRLDNLESTVSALEDNQFSTTTKLSGLVFFNLTHALAGGNVKVETDDLDVPIRNASRSRNTDNLGNPEIRTKTDDPGTTLSNLIWLTLNTSFSGKDSLVTQLAVENGNSPANSFASAGLFNTFGVPFMDQTAGVGGADIIVRELFYSFPVNDRLQLVVGPRVNWYRYFDGNAYTFFLNGAGSFNSIGSTLSNTLDRGAGVIGLWNINKKLQLNFGYLGESTEFLPNGLFNTANNPSDGLFGGTNTNTVELTYSPVKTFNARFLYNYSHLNALFGTIGGAMGEPIYGIADNGIGGGLTDSWANTFGVNFDWSINSRMGVFGRYTYASTNLEPIDKKINAQSIQAGLAFNDVGKEGSRATFSFVVPFDVLDGRKYLAAGGGNGGTQYEFEASYYYPLSNSLALVPSFYRVST